MFFEQENISSAEYAGTREGADMMKVTETIAAISTAMSDSGSGIVRISGPDAFEIADRIYKGKKTLS